jgi:hypothetical protein
VDHTAYAAVPTARPEKHQSSAKMELQKNFPAKPASNSALEKESA